MKHPVAGIGELRMLEFSVFIESGNQGSLRAIEFSMLPFDPKRIFTVGASAGGLRGNHAHKQCTQLLCCITGSVIVQCTDAENTSNVELKPNGDALLIPPGIWSSQTYEKDNSSLLVICDQPFDEDDYIRDFEKYRSLRKSK